MLDSIWEILPALIAVFLVKMAFRYFASSGASKLDFDTIQNCVAVKVDQSKKRVSDIFAENSIVAIYFSGHQCPPCRAFTPILADVYHLLKKQGKQFEVIFVSSDGSEEQMFSYMKDSHGDWFAFEYNSDASRKLAKVFRVYSIPTLLILKADGSVISANGRADVQNQGVAAWGKWTSH